MPATESADKSHRSTCRRLKPPRTTLVSRHMLNLAVNAILGRIRVDRRHDIPYLAGYSRDGRTIYIDRDLPATFDCCGRRVRVDRFLILHEAVEKALLDHLGLSYHYAHQIALRAEKAAVKASGVSWQTYDRFMRHWIKKAGNAHLRRIPLDLDLQPYCDEADVDALEKMLHALRRRRPARRSDRDRARRSRSQRDALH